MPLNYDAFSVSQLEERLPMPEIPTRPRLWIDADACPTAIKDIILRAAQRLSLETTFVANKPIAVPQDALITSVVIPQGPDVADAYIADHAIAGDIVVTQDIPLASILVSNGVQVINTHGLLYTTQNMGEKLANRNLMQELRDSGLISGGPKPYSEKNKRDFANTLDQMLTRRLKA